MTIDGLTGVHMTNKNETDVKGIWIHDTNTKFIPANLGVLFQLTTLIVQKSNLIEIKAENFLGMQNLEHLSLYNNGISYVSSDAFSTLSKLKFINLTNNLFTIHDKLVFLIFS